jgi:hypothetical protein
MSFTALARLSAFAVLAAGPALCAAEAPHPCEAETAKLMNIGSSWEELYSDAMALPDWCFDGYFAEGISDTLVRKMAADWSGFQLLITKPKKEEKFVRLVLRAINSTLDPKDIKAVDALATASCNPELETLCKAISKKAAVALAELE